jgi:hypothetical protein
VSGASGHFESEIIERDKVTMAWRGGGGRKEARGRVSSRASARRRGGGGRRRKEAAGEHPRRRQSVKVCASGEGADAYPRVSVLHGVGARVCVRTS